MFDGLPDCFVIPRSFHLLKQPTANKEKARQTEKEKYIVEALLRVAQTKATNMRINHENHRESPHRIDVCYPLTCHSTAKVQKKVGTFGRLSEKYYFCGMKERINWIDWGKALAACAVIFCHLPQSQEWFYYRYIQSVIIVIFFFISGYLKKDRGSEKENWRKYWYGLIIPYILYNAIIYPYWLLKFYLTNGTMPDFFAAMRPIVGTILLQHENAFAEPLNGPLWYLPAILIMHVIIDFCRKTKHEHQIMITLCVVSVILYAANKYWYFAPNLTPMGIMRNLPYYYIGYVMGQYQLFKDTRTKRNMTGCILCLTSSILLFAWHLNAFYAGQHILHIALFYPVNVLFLFGVLYGCKVLNNYHSAIITNLSVGTLVVIGFHIVLVTIANFVIEHLLHINGTICYQWYEALPLTILITAMLYPIILLSKRYIPMLLGRFNQHNI